MFCRNLDPLTENVSLKDTFLIDLLDMGLLPNFNTKLNILVWLDILFTIFDALARNDFSKWIKHQNTEPRSAIMTKNKSWTADAKGDNICRSKLKK